MRERTESGRRSMPVARRGFAERRSEGSEAGGVEGLEDCLDLKSWKGERETG